MPDDTQQPDNAPPSTPPPPQSPPPGPPPPQAAPPGGSDDRGLMIVFSYLWILCLVPLLSKKDNADIQWHAKHGLVLMVAEFLAWVALIILQVIPVLGQIIGCGLLPIALLAFVVLHIIAMMKGLKGERLIIPGISDFAEKF